MNRVRQIASLVVLLYVLSLLAGCSSGVGGTTDTVGTSFVPNQIAAGLYVLQWSQILWGLAASQTGTQEPVFGQPVINPDGTFSQTYTGPDGTVTVLTALLDGTLRLDITYPDGSKQTVVQGVPDFDGISKTTIPWEVNSADGTVVNYTSVQDDAGTLFDMSDDISQLLGTAQLPGGLTQEFDSTTSGGRTVLTSRQSDGSRFELDVPLAPPDYARPDFTQPATGTYRLGDLTVAFELTSTDDAPNRWGGMAATAPGGFASEVTLGADFAGAGRVSQDGQLLAVSSWLPSGDADVNWVSADSSETAPAGAVLDFLTHRWQTLAAIFALPAI
jgi:hypothetical protein